MGRHSKAQDLIHDDDLDDDSDYAFDDREQDDPDPALQGEMSEAAEESDMEEVRVMIARLEASSPKSQHPSLLFQSLRSNTSKGPVPSAVRQSISVPIALPKAIQPVLGSSAHALPARSIVVLPTSAAAKLVERPPSEPRSLQPAPASKPARPAAKPAKPATPKASAKALSMYAEYQRSHYGNLEHVYLVIAGHVDAGKSTLMGHLLYLLGCVSQKSLELYQRESHKVGKSSFAFAWILDEAEEERARGITMDVAVHSFVSPKRRWTILDAPGHKDFMSQMIQAAFLADVAILVVDASKGEFEAGWMAGGQSKEHALVLKSAGVKHMIVAVNKMDKVDWSFARFQYIQGAMEPFLNGLGYRGARLAFVPVSGYAGLHLVERHALASAYPGESQPCLLETLDRSLAFEQPDGQPAGALVSRPFRAVVYQLLKTFGAGNAFVEVKIEGGMVAVGEAVQVLPLAQKCIVKAIEVKAISEPGFAQVSERQAFWNDYVTLAVSGIDPAFLRTGQLLCAPAFPAAVAFKVVASILVFDDSLDLITPGLLALFYYRNAMDSCRVSKLVSLLDPKDHSVLKSCPRFLRKGDLAKVEIAFSKAIAIETRDTDKRLSRLILRASGLTIAGGIVLETL